MPKWIFFHVLAHCVSHKHFMYVGGRGCSISKNIHFPPIFILLELYDSISTDNYFFFKVASQITHVFLFFYAK